MPHLCAAALDDDPEGCALLLAVLRGGSETGRLSPEAPERRQVVREIEQAKREDGAADRMASRPLDKTGAPQAERRLSSARRKAQLVTPSLSATAKAKQSA